VAPRVGFTLQPEGRFLELVEPVFSLVDYLEITPETTWIRDAHGELIPNGFRAKFAELAARHHKTCVAHGVGFSVGSASPDPGRRRAWLERIRADREVFGFEWYTDHLGASVVAGHELALPMPLPMDPEAEAVVRSALKELQREVPDVGVENTVFYFHLGDPLDEPAFLAAILSEPRMHLLLDLHNVYTTALNAGFDPWRYIERLPLERVIEIHVSGGSESEPEWLRSGRSMRLDSHDGAVPEPVWRLLERVLPRCPSVRGVTLERMEGTVESEHVPLLTGELRRIRRTIEASRV